MLLGGAIGVTGSVILVVAFRALAPEVTEKREFRAWILIAGLLAFVMLCCALLLRFSLA